MKTRGVQNAINRLKGARQLGSPTLLAQAETEAQHALTQARAWLERAANPDSGKVGANYDDMVKAVEALELALATP
ncbi:hypothetical protein [Acidithiobacillus sp.]|jgi:hypothetical protein|uniref:hypothetical protein n=1 Tax=Acidithiobacillus sp. TaxID=1872118 RepID=UPI00260A15A8|nr:hypothetical protein [Acidithiobacillus sp.]